MTRARPISSRYMPSLDGLRGLAIVWVIAHQLNFFDFAHGGIWAGRVNHLLEMGWIGVQLFFVLSGFLISGILLDTCQAKHAYRDFMLRRALRIFPLYFLMLLLVYVVWPAMASTPPSQAVTLIREDAPTQIWLWTFMANWTSVLPQHSRIFPHFWSLAVEEQFYWLWPALALPLAPRQLLRASLLVMALSLLLRLWMSANGAPSGALYTFTWCRMDALAAGAAIACGFRVPDWQARIERHRVGVIGLAWAILLVGFVSTHGYAQNAARTQTWGYSVLSMGLALWLAGLVAQDLRHTTTGPRLQGGLRARWIRSIGKYSYAMYILHMPLHVFIGERLRNSMHLNESAIWVNACYSLPMIVVLYVLARLSWLVIEHPFLRLKSRLAPRAAEHDLGATG